jgi:hypothetical protein
MQTPKLNITLCSVAVAVSALAWTPAPTDTTLPGDRLCALGVGAGAGLHGHVVEPCGRLSLPTRKPMPTISVPEPPPPTLAADPIVPIARIFTRRALLHNALISTIP